MRIDVTFDAVAAVFSTGKSDCDTIDGTGEGRMGEAAGEAEDELRPKPSFHLLAFFTIGGSAGSDCAGGISTAADACVPMDIATLSGSEEAKSGAT